MTATHSDREVYGGSEPAVAFEAWYRASWGRLVAAVALDAGDVAAAEDAVADAMAQAVARWDDGSIRSPDAWVYRVALRRARRNRWRRRRESLEVAPEGSTEVQADPDLWRAVAALPERQRRAVVLRYLLDLTQDAVAREMDIAPGTAAALLTQARTRLKEAKGLSSNE